MCININQSFSTRQSMAAHHKKQVTLGPRAPLYLYITAFVCFCHILYSNPCFCFSSPHSLSLHPTIGGPARSVSDDTLSFLFGHAMRAVAYAADLELNAARTSANRIRDGGATAAAQVEIASAIKAGEGKDKAQGKGRGKANEDEVAIDDETVQHRIGNARVAFERLLRMFPRRAAAYTVRLCL
jgi:hypothetical protein